MINACLCAPLRFLLAVLICHSAAAYVDAAEHSSSQAAWVKDLNTPRQFPAIDSRLAWQKRAAEIRQQVLVSCGLWPMPEKAPLGAQVFGRIEREGYSIEKVYFQTAPGFYLGGNLYRPLGKDKGPFPGVLNPHGHWKEGRMADTKDGSIAARCISFARQGMVAFSYDMVGFNDTHFADAPTNRPFYEIHRQFATEPADQLWNISLMGLQTWNSIRALDFLASLPDVDSRRLACTGESGGGTQTYMLGAIDDRLAAQAPVVMVSHTMQGGCSCENAPGLRVEYSNMEIAAAACPRPQLLVAATGDWTKDTLTVEGPAIAHIYELLGARPSFDYQRFDFGHNYNQTSREAVYQFFGRWLLRDGHAALVKEQPYQKEPDDQLRVFADNCLPANAKTRAEFTEYLRQVHQGQWQALAPNNAAGLKKFREVMLPAWRHTLQLQAPAAKPQLWHGPLQRAGSANHVEVRITCPGETAPIACTYWAPAEILKKRSPKLVVLCNEQAPHQGTSAEGAPAGIIAELLDAGLAVLELERFSSETATNQFANFYSTYNRTKVQSRVRDLVTACETAGQLETRQPVRFKVVLLGQGPAGLWALLAAPTADAVVADCNGLGAIDDQGLLAPDFFCPGIRNVGTFQGAPILAAPHPLLVHNFDSTFPLDQVRAGYAAAKAGSKFTQSPGRLSPADLVKWIREL